MATILRKTVRSATELDALQGVDTPQDDGEYRLRLKSPRRRQHQIRWLATIAGSAILLLSLLLANAAPSPAIDTGSPLLGKLAPEIIGTSLTGNAFHLSDYRGKFVVIDFFTSWCVACQKEQPELVKFSQQEFGHFQLVGVILPDTIRSVRKFLQPWVGLYPVLADPGGSIALNYGVLNPPTKFLVDPQGVVIEKILGPVTASWLEAQITKAQARGL